ncbi:MAG: DUF6491 family protein [Steroidobacteraceae bacterium]
MNLARPLLVACFLLSAPTWAADADQAQQAKTDENACTWFNSIDDWRRLDDRNLIVWASPREAYHVELTMPLIDLDTASSIGFIDHNRDGRLCGFGMDEIVVPRSPVFNTATIAAMTRLDDAGMQALAQKYNIKLRYAGNKIEDATSKKEEKG